MLQSIRSLRQDIAYAVATRGGVYWPLAGRTLERLEQLIVRPVRLNIFGEANTGKSSLVNFLLRQTVIPAGDFASQGTFLRICHAKETVLSSIAADGTRNRLTSKALSRISEPEILLPSDGEALNGKLTHDGRVLELGVPHEFLRRVEIIEARNYPEVRSSRALAQVFRPADMTIWCTLATQAWKETERTVWSHIPLAQRKNAFLFVTYRDAIRNRKDEAKIIARLKNDGEHAFADVLMVSVRDAHEAKLARESEQDAAMAERLHKRSNAEAIEEAVSSAVTFAQLQKLRKSASVLKRVASIVRKADANHFMGPGQHIAQKLERVAGETLLIVDRAETR
ncbi:MAG: hypothetical protein P8Y67_02540 [Alphaproteobacteria bacterium]